jgi:hypothetical protein
VVVHYLPIGDCSTPPRTIADWKQFLNNQTVRWWDWRASCAKSPTAERIGYTEHKSSLHRKRISSLCFTIHKQIYGTYSARTIRGDTVNTTLFVLADRSAYQITSIDGKGLGLIATTRIFGRGNFFGRNAPFDGKYDKTYAKVRHYPGATFKHEKTANSSSLQRISRRQRCWNSGYK